MNYYIGVDLGTSAMKLLLMDAKGDICNIVTKDYPLSSPHPGWSEQDPEDWRRALLEGIPELLRGCDGGNVAGIGCAGQMHGLVVLDENDELIRPAILLNDWRTAKQVEQLNDGLGREKLSALTANIAFAGFTAPKLLWMRENEPENYHKIEKIMLPKDYVNYILTGVHATDYSDASGTLLLDVEHKRWSGEMLEICGVAETQLPKLFESFAPIGTVKPEMADALGISRDTVVCAGAGDNAAAAVGTGVVGEGGCNISLGTSGTLFISSQKFKVFTPNRAEENATPCAWLPAEAVITPCAFCSSVRPAIMAYAPRSLKLCTGWRSSRFTRMTLSRRDDSFSIFCSGVTCAAS